MNGGPESQVFEVVWNNYVISSEKSVRKIEGDSLFSGGSWEENWKDGIITLQFLQ